MAHQAKPKPFSILHLIWESNSIIYDRESKYETIRSYANVDILRGSVFGCVRGCLLSNPVELRSNRRIAHWNRLFSVQNAVDRESLAYVFGRTFQGDG